MKGGRLEQITIDTPSRRRECCLLLGEPGEPCHNSRSEEGMWSCSGSESENDVHTRLK